MLYFKYGKIATKAYEFPNAQIYLKNGHYILNVRDKTLHNEEFKDSIDIRSYYFHSFIKDLHIDVKKDWMIFLILDKKGDFVRECENGKVYRSSFKRLFGIKRGEVS